MGLGEAKRCWGGFKVIILCEKGAGGGQLLWEELTLFYTMKGLLTM